MVLIASVQDNPLVKASLDWVEHTSVGRRYYYNKRTRQYSWVKPLKLMAPIESRKPKDLHNLLGSLYRSLIKEVKVKNMEENEDKPSHDHWCRRFRQSLEELETQPRFHVACTIPLTSLRPRFYKSLSPLLSIGFEVQGVSSGSISDKEASSKVEGGVSRILEAHSHTDQIIFKLFRKGTIHLDWWTLRGDS